MSMNDYEAAVRMIMNRGDGDFEGSKDDALVSAAEFSLDVIFPPSYRRFLKELGCGDVGGEEFYGIIDSNFEQSAVPNGVWLTLINRKNIDLDKRYVLFYTDGDGSFCAIDTHEKTNDGENPVVRLSVDGTLEEKVADSFGSFLLRKVAALDADS